MACKVKCKRFSYSANITYFFQVGIHFLITQNG